MYPSERQEQILALLKEEKSISVHKLAKLLFTSESSIRRDLAALQDLGHLKRTFGGAVLFESAEKEVSLMYRSTQNMREKAIIAQKAAVYLADGMTIFLDASSSAAQMLPYLKKYNDLTVITNSPQTSLQLGEMKIRNYCTGGLLLRHSIAYVGSGAEDFIRRFNADLLFFSCRGFSSEGGLTDSMEEEARIRQIMMKRSRKTIFLCDRSKYDQTFPYRICDIQDVDVLISE